MGLEKKVLIAIPTYKRSKIVEYFLDKNWKYIDNTDNLFIGFFDSSPDEETEIVVKKYMEKTTKIFYKKYPESWREEKLFDVYKIYGKQFDYIWMNSDRKVLRLEKIIPLIANEINCGVDLILFSKSHIESDKRMITEIEQLSIMFYEIINLAKVIVGKNMFQLMCNEDIYIKYIGSGFAEQAMIMEYCGNNDFLAVQYSLKDSEIAETGSVEFQHEWSDKAVWQWSKSWCDTIDKMPITYDAYKEMMIRENDIFSLKKLLARKATGTIYHVKDVKKYKESLRRINVNLLNFYIVFCIPKFFLIIPYKAYKHMKNKI